MATRSLRLVVMVVVMALVPMAGSHGDQGQTISKAINGQAKQLASQNEVDLIQALSKLGSGESDAALQGLATLIERKPNFKLAQLIYGDLLLSKSRPLTGFGQVPGASPTIVSALRDEVEVRVRYHRKGGRAGLLPENLLRIAGDQEQVIAVDIADSRLYVFENRDGLPRLVHDYYVSTGKNGAAKLREGDQRTPVGVYFITGRIEPNQLSDFYGRGAFPVNYPNEWDLRNGRTGYGIWIHGVPTDTYTRAPRASDGCMALSNDAIVSLWSKLAAFGTTQLPVIIADGLVWTDQRNIETESDQLTTQINAWRKDWESRRLDRYAGHYSRSFTSESHDYASWVRYKGRVNGAKTFIKVRLNNLSLLKYPGEQDLVVASFDQDYRSSNFSNTVSKRQYWQREADGRWRIVYEGTARLRDEHLRGIPYSARKSLTKLD